MKTTATSVEGDAYGVLEAALQTSIANGEPYGDREQARDHQEHAEPARDEAVHDNRSAQEQEGQAEQDAEESGGPTRSSESVSASAKRPTFRSPARRPVVYCLLERDPIHGWEERPRPLR